jgi:uridylate cyclase
MAFTDDLNAEVVKILKEPWTVREGNAVPETTQVELGNNAVKITGAVLYADLADSTGMVMGLEPNLVAAIYKCYLNCACRIISAQEGAITAFDGDRVMAVFLGDTRSTRAVRSALAINHSVTNIINPKLREQHPSLPADFKVKQAVGIDVSDLFVARAGIRGTNSNDLVWVGRAAHYAAKMCALRQADYATWITTEVYQQMQEPVKTTNGTSMWEQVPWAERNLQVYRSRYHWGL